MDTVYQIVSALADFSHLHAHPSFCLLTSLPVCLGLPNFMYLSGELRLLVPRFWMKFYSMGGHERTKPTPNSPVYKKEGGQVLVETHREPDILSIPYSEELSLIVSSGISLQVI